MKLGIFCIVAGIIGFAINVIGIIYWQWGYLRGIIFMPLLALFGLYLTRRAKRKKYLDLVKEWSRENPSEAAEWSNKYDNEKSISVRQELERQMCDFVVEWDLKRSKRDKKV